jgi:hypothetical protein
MSTEAAPTHPRAYRAYLLRLWQVECDGQPEWRASLEDTHTGERRGFADLARLFNFLQNQTGVASPGARPKEP